MNQFQAHSHPAPTGYAHFGQQHYPAHHQPHYAQQPHSAQALFELQLQQQQQAQQAAYLAQLQLQSHLIQQQLAHQHHALAAQHQLRSPPFQQQAQFPRQQLAVSQNKRSQSASRADAAKSWLPAASQASEQESTNPLVASALARQRQRASLTLDGHPNSAPVTSAATPNGPASRCSSAESNHHRRTSSGQSQRSPEPPALIVSRPGEPFPDTSGSESSSVAGDDDKFDSDPHSLETDKLEKGLEQLNIGQGRPSQATTLARALSGRQRQRPASLQGLASPPLGAALNGEAPAFRAPSPSNSQAGFRSVSDSTVLSPFANSYTPLGPVFSPTLAQFSSPPIAQTPTFTNNGGNLNQSGRAAPPVKGGAAAVRMPKGPVQAELMAESNFAQRLRRAAVAQLACSHRG